MVTEALIAWLRNSDPALRWQVERDLMREPPQVWEATRARIASEGFGARLLALQDPDGQWAGGAFFPADFDFHGPEAAEDAGQPWWDSLARVFSPWAGTNGWGLCASGRRSYTVRYALSETSSSVPVRWLRAVGSLAAVAGPGVAVAELPGVADVALAPDS